MNRWLRRNALPLTLSVIAISGWIGYLALALSDTTPSWVPEALRLPSSESGASILSRRAEFGDAFGAFNALVSTLALIGLLFTLRTQQEQIRSQERTSASNDTLIRQQQFQDQFFRAVDAYRDQLQTITAPNPTGTGNITGRLALRDIWRNQLVLHIDHSGLPSLKETIAAQLDAYSNEMSGIWNSHQEASQLIARLLNEIEKHRETHDKVLNRIGSAWHAVNLANRHQLDSLHRAWHTVYIVLDAAPKYGINAETINLYSATFKAQISWIEMAFLLANQFGLPGNPTYPTACEHSVRYAAFDNLDRTYDTVIGILSSIASKKVDLPPNTMHTRHQELSASAFGRPVQAEP